MPHFMSFFLVLLLSNSNYGQPFSELWERYLGGVRSDEIHATIEDKRGRIIAVGQTRSKSFKEADVLLRILDRNGDILFKDNIGGKKDDNVFSLIESFDGGFLMAGYTASKWKNVDSLFEFKRGKSEAWIVKVDENGERLWHRTFGSSKNDRFKDIIQLQDGSLIAAGQKGQFGMIVKISENGERGIWERELSESESIIESICLDNDSNILFTGTMGKKNEQAFVLKMDQNGKVLIPLKSIHQDLCRGKEIVFDFETNKYVLAGDINQKPGRKDMGVFFLNKKLEVEDFKSYGGAADDQVESLIQLSDGNFILAGHTKSHKRVARRSRGMYVFISREGQTLESSEEVLGGLQKDCLSAISELSDGNYLLSGTSASNPGSDTDAWIVKVAGKNKPYKSIRPEEIKVSMEDSRSRIMNNELYAKERNYLNLSLQNQSDYTATGLKVYLSSERDIEGLQLMDTIYIKPFQSKGEQKIRIPINGDLDLASDSTTLKINIVNAEEESLGQFDFKLKTKAIPLPQLEITQSRFIADYDLPERNETIKLEVIIKNTGDKIAEKTAARIFLPDRVKYLKKKIIKIGDLKPNESQTIIFSFKAKSYYAPDTIPIYIAAIESTVRRGANLSTGIRIKNFYGIEDDPDFFREPTNNYFRDQKSKGGPSAPSGIHFIEFNPETFYWRAPNEDDEGYDHKEKINTIPIKIKVRSKIELEYQDFQLYINDEEAIAGVNMNEKATGIAPSSTYRPDNYVYTYNAEVLLKKGENKIVLKVKSETGWLASLPMNIFYELPQSNLHVYAFGIPHEDLKFTTKDAKDFGQSFKQQSGKIFKEVKVHTFIRPKETTERALRIAMEKIHHDFILDEKINEGDAIIIFISSHGFIDNRKPKEFRIAASDFDQIYARPTSIEFEDDILGVLDQMPTIHKFIFIDACYSGAIANQDEGTKSNNDLEDPALSKAIVDLANAAAGFNTIVSCSIGELSYEDEKWGNGSFTKGILEAFNNAKVKGKNGTISADQNKDGILYMLELYNFLKERVPTIVKTKRPRVSQLQHPYMPETQEKEDKPIFVY